MLRSGEGSWYATFGLASVALACTPPSVAQAPPEPVGVDPSLLIPAELAPGDREVKCENRARCLLARAHPEVRFVWALGWPEFESDEHQQQVLERLRADGARDVFVPLSDKESVTVFAPSSAVRGAIALEFVRSVTVACADDDREFCACDRLRLDQCGMHPFCQSVYGWPRCREPKRLAGCTRAEGCRLSGSHAFDPSGVLWEFPDGCQPDQPGWRSLGTRWAGASSCRGATGPRW